MSFHRLIERLLAHTPAAHPKLEKRNLVELTGANLIGGSEVKSAGATFRAVNPSTGGEFDPAFHEATPADIDRALEEAEGAFPVFARTPLATRARFLRLIAEELNGLGDELIERAASETGLPTARLQNERTRAVHQLRLFADYVEEGSWVEARIDRPAPARTPVPRPDLRRMLVPLGPVVVFGASNFPLAFSVAGGDTASALGAGCPVVFKAHPAHPGTSELAGRAVLRAAAAAGAPEGVFSLAHGWSHEVGLALVRHPLTRAVGFTGSLRGGRALFDAAAARPDPIPVYAEMGSVNPVLLLPGALEERGPAIAQGLAQSITMGVGQFCTKPGLVVGVGGDSLDRFRQALAGQIGDAQPGIMLYRGLRTAFRSALERARAMGSEVVATSRSAPASGCGAEPTLLSVDAGRLLADPELREEMFGPASVLVAAGDASELMRVAEALDGQLTATIHGTAEELLASAPLIETLRRRAGRLIFNGYPTGVEVGHAMQHGGPYPASTDSRSTSVGTAAITRFARPVCYQDFPDAALPAALRNRNELGICRMIDGEFTREDVRS